MTYLCGLLGDIYNIDAYPPRIGWIITACVVFSYVTCCPMFLWAASAYEQQIKKENARKLLKSISRLSRKTLSKEKNVTTDLNL